MIRNLLFIINFLSNRSYIIRRTPNRILTKDFRHIFNTYYSPLCNYATKIIHDDNKAEDIVQALFIQLWENKKLETVDKLEPFLLRSTKFKCIDFLRSKTRQREVNVQELPEAINDTDSSIGEEDIEPLLHFFAAKLPPKTRQVFLLSREKGLSYKEISAQLGVSTKTVENQMGTALKKMRVLLKEHKFFSLILFL